MAKRLDALADQFVSRAMQCYSIFENSTSEGRAYAVIRLYSEWENFSQRLVYTSALKSPVTATGSRLSRPLNVRDAQDVHARVCLALNKPSHAKFSVPWGTPAQMAKICKSVAVANANTISPAVTSVNSPADDLRLIRNFLAHRNKGTVAQVVLAPNQGDISVSEVLRYLSAWTTGGVTQLRVWIGDLADVARACVQ